MRWSVLVDGALIFIVTFGLFLGTGGEARANVGVPGDEPTPFFPSHAISSVGVTEIFTPACQIYLPFVGQNFPPVVQVPADEYLLVEYWTHSVLGAECAAQFISFPGYHFAVQSGTLAVYTTDPPEPALVLGEGEIGYIGNGVSLGGVGGGSNSGLTKFQRLPVSQGGITLHYVDESGGINLERQGEMMYLQPGEAWTSDEEVETWDWLGAGCIVTSTHRITNYAFQDRAKIVYSEDAF